MFRTCASTTRLFNKLPNATPLTLKITLQAQKRAFTSSTIRMSSSSSEPTERAFPNLTSADAGEKWEPRQTLASADQKPDPSKTLPLSPARQELVDDVIALYSCEPTVQRVKRYTPDCVYDDQFVYANDRYKMAGQWFALPKLFKASKNLSYQVVVNKRDLIQFKNEQSWTFIGIPKTATINALVSLSLDPDSVDAVDKNGGKGFIQIKYHKDQANEKDYSHEGLGFDFKVCRPIRVYSAV